MTAGESSIQPAVGRTRIEVGDRVNQGIIAIFCFWIVAVPFIPPCHLMKAAILAAGKGTRMKELTNEIPKPMLKVEGKPILQHIVEGLLTTGIREIFIVTGFRAEVIENHFGDGSRWNARIQCGRQTVQDGTGKAPEVAKDFIGASPFLLTYGD